MCVLATGRCHVLREVQLCSNLCFCPSKFCLQEVPYQRVHSSVWKKQMGLYRQGKEGSLALARQAFPAVAATLLR